jgi:hypothetical protein
MNTVPTGYEAEITLVDLLRLAGRYILVINKIYKFVTMVY